MKNNFHTHMNRFVLKIDPWVGGGGFEGLKIYFKKLKNK